MLTAPTLKEGSDYPGHVRAVAHHPVPSIASSFLARSDGRTVQAVVMWSRSNDPVPVSTRVQVVLSGAAR